MVRPDDPGDAHPALAQLLEDHRHRRVVETETAVLFRYGDAEQPQLPHRRDELVGVRVLVIILRCNWQYVVLNELAYETDDLSARFF